MRCRVCEQELPKKNFFFRKETGKYRSECKRCCTEKAKERRRAKGVPSRKEWLDSVTKYSSAEERKEAARERSKQWYADNTERAKKRIYEWQRNNKDKVKATKDKHKKRNPDYWRHKKKVDKIARRKWGGKVPRATLIEVESRNLDRYGKYTCIYCLDVLPVNESGPVYHIEHLTPLSRGGTNDPDNLDLSCSGCNLSKSNKTYDEYRRSRKKGD